MVVTREWHPTTRHLLPTMTAAAALLVAAAIVAVVPWPPITHSAATDEVVRWSAVALLFIVSAVPLARFLFLASITTRHGLGWALVGEARRDEAEPAPPFTPSRQRRFLGLRWREGTMPSSRVWVFSRRARGSPLRRNLLVILSSTAPKDSLPVRAAKDRLRQWLRRFAR